MFQKEGVGTRRLKYRLPENPSILNSPHSSVRTNVWSVIRVKFRKQIMLWCLIFHSAELQNYVPALHGIMFGSFNFNKKCNKLCSRLAVFLSLVQFCSAPPNYVRNAASRIMFGK